MELSIRSWCCTTINSREFPAFCFLHTHWAKPLTTGKVASLPFLFAGFLPFYFEQSTGVVVKINLDG